VEDNVATWQYKHAWFYTYQEHRTLKSPITHSRLNVDGTEFEDTNAWSMLDHLGAEGWELLAVTPWVDSRPGSFAQNVFAVDPVNVVHTKGFYLWFKRPAS
jgi:hypothetical protein